MTIGRRSFGILAAIGLTFVLSGCGNESNSVSIASVINSSIEGDVSVKTSDVGVTFHRNIILGTSADMGGTITFDGIYSDELEKKLKDSVENAVQTTSQVAGIDRGKIDIQGVSGARTLTASEAYYGKKGEDLTIKKVLNDLDAG